MTPQKIEREKPRAPTLCFIILAVSIVLLYIPILNVILQSFIQRMPQSFNLTFEWYKQLCHDQDLIDSIIRSFLIALGSSFISVLMALVSALSLLKTRFVGNKLLKFFSLTSIILPELVMALSLLSMFVIFQFDLGLHTVIVGHVTLTCGFALLIIVSRLEKIGTDLDDAAKDLGATDLQIIKKIYIPLLTPSLVSAYLLSIALSFDDFLLSYYLGGVGMDTLPVKLYSSMRFGHSPKILALSSLLILITVFIAVILRRINSKIIN